MTEEDDKEKKKKRGLDKSEREGSTMARHENEIRYPPYRLVPRSQEIEKRSIDTTTVER